MAQRREWNPDALTPFEQRVYDHYQKYGWQVLRNGWPDFLLVKGQKVVGIEAKSATDKLSTEQKRMHTVLARVGLPVHVVGEVDLTFQTACSVRVSPRAATLKSATREVERLRLELVQKLQEVQELTSKLTAYAFSGVEA